MYKQFLHKGRKVFAVLISMILVFTSLVVPANANSSVEKSVKGILPDYRNLNSSQKSIIVKYKDEKKSSFVKHEIMKKLDNYKVNIKRSIENIDIIETSNDAEYEMVINELKNNKDIEYAQPDYKLKKLEASSDDLSSKQWGISNSGQTVVDQTGVSGIDINVQPVWKHEKGNENLIVGVLDTGIDIDHSELKDSIYVNKKEIPDNGIDDDQNGYIDDITGWDFMNSDNTVYDNSTEDFHATLIAGIIAAKHDGKGINGIAPGVKILPLKFMNVNDGFTSDAIEAIRYAKNMGVKIINCSFGDTNYNYALEKEMRESGILFVCAAGNDSDNLDSYPKYPASFDIPNKITVAAVSNKGQICNFSNYGSMADVAAPGENILSTIPDGKFDYASGTSMAAPFVTSTAALLWSYNPSYGFSKVKENIKSRVNKMEIQIGKIATSGIVNAAKAFYTNNISFESSVLTRTTDKINVDNFTSGYLSGYTFDDMIPLVDGWVIIGDVIKNKVFILNVLSGEIAKEYQLNSTPDRIDFNPDKGKIIASQRSSNYIALIDAHSDEIKYIPVSGSCSDVVFAKNNCAIAITSISLPWLKQNSRISILDWEKGMEISSISDEAENYTYLSYNKNTNKILASDFEGSGYTLGHFFFDENTRIIEKKNSLYNFNSDPDDLVLSPDGYHAVLTGGGYQVDDIDATNISNQFGRWWTSRAESAAFSNDSKYIIFAGDGLIEIYDVITHTLVDEIHVTPRLSKITISRSGKTAFCKGYDGKLYYYFISLPSTTTESTTVTPTSIPTPSLPQTPQPTTTPQLTPVPSPTIVLNTSIPELTKMSDSIYVNNSPSGSVSGYSFGEMVPVADGWVIIGDSASNKIFILNALTGEIKKEYRLNELPGKIEFNYEKGKILVTQNSSNSIALINPYTDEIKYLSVSGKPIDVAFSKNNYAVVLLSTGNQQKISILDLENGIEVTSNSDKSGDWSYLDCDKKTNNILVGGSKNLYRFIFNENLKNLELKQVSLPIATIGQGIEIAPDGIHAAFFSGNYIFDIETTNINNIFGLWGASCYPLSASFSKDNKYVISTDGSSITIMDAKTHTLIDTIPSFENSLYFTKIGISSGGKIVYAIDKYGRLHYYLNNHDPSITVPTPVVLNNSIKGKVHLPGDLIADEDIHIEVYLQNAKEKICSTSVVIKKGTNLQEYILLSPNTSENEKFIIGYNILDGGNSLAKSGIYSSSGTTFDEDYAESLTVGSNLEGKDLELLVKRTISGKISLPDGKTAPRGGIEIKVVAGYKNNEYYTDYITIEEGKTSSNFEVAAYANDSNNKYILHYNILGDMDGFFSYGFFNGAGTTINIENADPIDIRHNDVSNIQLPILKGRTISGTIKLPDNRTAPEGGIKVQVFAESKDQENNYSSMVKIDQEKNSADYFLLVPDENKSYYVNYFTIASGYVRSGYFQGINTVVEHENASIINVNSNKASGVDLTLITAKTFMGTVSLPYGTAPKDGVRVMVTAQSTGSEDLSISTYVTIKEGFNSADYKIPVPLNSGWYTISYYTEEKGYVKEGFCNNCQSPSVYFSDAIEYKSYDNNEEVIHIQLIKGIDITGVISLSTGVAPSGGLLVYVFLSDDSGKVILQPILISSRNSKVNFNITAPCEYNLWLGYFIPSTKSIAFYSNGRMVQYQSDASPMNLGDEPIKDISMVISWISSDTNNGNSGNQGNSNNIIVPPVLPPISSIVPTATATTTATVTPTPTAALITEPKPTDNIEKSDKKPNIGIYKDILGHWAEEYSNKLSDLGIISGYEDNTIRPNNEITRAEAVVIICKSIGLKPAENIMLGFSDNKSIPNWASGYVKAIIDKGILKGYPDNTFRPNAKITRAEVIALVIKAFGLDDKPNNDHKFNDAKNIAPWAKNYIQKAYELGIITGYNDNTIRPANKISRAEMFVIIAKCIGIKK